MLAILSTYVSELSLSSSVLGFLSSLWGMLCETWMEVLIVATALHVYMYLSPPAKLKGLRNKGASKQVDVSHDDKLQTLSAVCSGKSLPQAQDRNKGIQGIGVTEDFRRLVATLLSKGNGNKCGPEALEHYEAFIRSQGGRRQVNMRQQMADEQSARTFYLGLISCAVHASRGFPGARNNGCSPARFWVTQLLTDMRAFGFPRNQDFFSSALRAFANSRYADDALWLHDEALADVVEPDRSMYICLLNTAVSCENHHKAIFFFRELSKHGAPSMRTYMTILRTYGKQQDWKGAVELLDSMPAADVCPDALVLNTVLGLCVSSSPVRVPENVVNKWEASADVISFNILLKSYAQRGQLAQAEAMLQRLLTKGPTPNLISFNTVMDCAVRSMQPNAAGVRALAQNAAASTRRPWELLDKLMALGLQPDRYTCSTLVKGMHVAGCSVEDIDRVTELLRSIGPVALQQGTDSASGSSNARLREVLFNTLLDACVNLRDLDRMGAIFHMMEEFGVEVSAVTFGTLIKAFGQAGKLAYCHEVWQKLRESKVEPTVVTFGCYIDACIRCADMVKAEEVFHSMRSMRVQPNAVIFTSLIRGFAHANQPLKALDIYQSMRRQGVEATTITFNSVLEVIARQLSDPSKLQEVLRDMQAANMPPDAVTYSILIKASCTAGDVSSGLVLLRQIRDHGLAVDEVAYNTLLLACSKADRFEDAEEIFKEMSKFGIKPTHVTASILVKMYGKAKMLEKAIELTTRFEAEFHLKPNLFVYTCLIQACVQNKQVRRSWDVFNDMLRGGIQPDAVTFGTVIHGCIHRNKFDEAMSLVRHAYMRTSREPQLQDGAFAYEHLRLEQPLPLQPEVLRTLKSALRRKEQMDALAELEAIVKTR